MISKESSAFADGLGGSTDGALIQAKRFVMLMKEAHQIAQTSPKRSSQMFEQAKEMMPMRWTPRMQEWLEYTTLLSQKQTSEDSELSEEK